MRTRSSTSVCSHALTDAIKVHSQNVMNVLTLTFGSRFSCEKAKLNSVYENAVKQIRLLTVCIDYNSTTLGLPDGCVSFGRNSNSGTQTFTSLCDFSMKYILEIFPWNTLSHEILLCRENESNNCIPVADAEIYRFREWNVW